ncbi:hypothetical protein AB1Y20_005502 [Prymnesium parvum]|uniref:Uncharacterized protein n=1 Tax=Prymnesium parvum TaxID=97485 RepID=A0AB34J6F3_PRYPA
MESDADEVESEVDFEECLEEDEMDYAKDCPVWLARADVHLTRLLELWHEAEMELQEVCARAQLRAGIPKEKGGVIMDELSHEDEYEDDFEMDEADDDKVDGNSCCPLWLVQAEFALAKSKGAPHPSLTPTMTACPGAGGVLERIREQIALMRERVEPTDNKFIRCTDFTDYCEDNVATPFQLAAAAC